MTAYAFDNAWQQARRRLALLEECLDPATQRRMSALGLHEGWSCLEPGAGGGSIVDWLCSQVGAPGRVLATDLDTRFLDALTRPNLEVRRHNLASDALPAGAFDLVHTRLVLMHIPEREQILPRLVAALKPGGWLLLEEHDIFPVTAAAGGPYAEMWGAVTRALHAAGGLSDWGRRLPALLAAQGLAELGAEGDVPVFPGGSAMAEFWRLSWEQLREPMRKTGAHEQVLDRALDALGDARQWFLGPATMAAWGRRPAR
ncbi:MAG TPA: class I SAM-dependent methyltransferase [Dehalococcoidia bacterium]|nr:class I SAM-dependent methyltransferase [Dehalococcoidia bacterium]